MIEAVVLVSQLGFVLATTVIVGLALGVYLDSLANSRPLFTILGTLLGTASGIYSCAQIARYALRDRRAR